MPDDLRVSFPRPCNEKWEAMAPAGCDRVCARCDTVIHDLSQYDFDEAAAMLRGNRDVCVRARIDAEGGIVLKPGRSSSMRRMVIAMGAAGLLASQPAPASQERPSGAIVGQVYSFGYSTEIIATDASGNSYRAKTKRDGTYKIKRVPAGTYTLTFHPGCGDSWTVKNIVVGSGEAIVPASPNEGGCVIVGKLLIEASDIDRSPV
jgi:hypothetical protein